MNKDAYSSSPPSSSFCSPPSSNKPSPSAPSVFPPPMPLLPITSPVTLHKCKMYPARGRDIFIASYPKSGTTWTQNIVYQLLVAEAEVKRRARRKERGLCKTNAGQKRGGGSRRGIEDGIHNSNGEKDEKGDEYPPPFKIEHISEIAPFFEVNRTWQQERGGGEKEKERNGQDLDVESGVQGSQERGEGWGEIALLYRQKQGQLGRRVFNTHLRWEQMPKPIPQVREEREGGGDDGVLVVGTADSNKQKEEVDDEDEEEKAEPCYLYLVRDGRDVCVSFYHHLKSMASDDGGYQGEFADFFEEWIEGRLPYGRWMDHVVSWLAREGGREGEEEEEEGKRKEHDSNYEKEGERKGRVLVVRYEDLKKDLMGGLKRIAKHCRISLRTRGREGAREGEVEKSTGDMKKGQEGARTKEEEEKKEEEEDRMWETVKEKCSFEYMVENRKMFEPRSVTWTDPAFRFIRKGEVGDHKVHFTEEQLRRFAGSVKEWFGEEGGGGEGERRRAPVHVTQMLESWEGFLDV